MEKKSGTWKSTLIKIIVGLVIISVGGFFVYFYLPYGDSNVKAGQLNYDAQRNIV